MGNNKNNNPHGNSHDKQKNSNQNNNYSNECWKMTSLCRDVLSTSNLDEYGYGKDDDYHHSSSSHHGSHNNNDYTSPQSQAAMIVALFVGLFSSTFIIYLIRGGTLSSLPSLSSFTISNLLSLSSNSSQHQNDNGIIGGHGGGRGNDNGNVQFQPVS